MPLYRGIKYKCEVTWQSWCSLVLLLVNYSGYYLEKFSLNVFQGRLYVLTISMVLNSCFSVPFLDDELNVLVLSRLLNVDSYTKNENRLFLESIKDYSRLHRFHNLQQAEVNKVKKLRKKKKHLLLRNNNKDR